MHQYLGSQEKFSVCCEKHLSSSNFSTERSFRGMLYDQISSVINL